MHKPVLITFIIYIIKYFNILIYIIKLFNFIICIFINHTTGTTYPDPHHFGKNGSFNNSWWIFSQIIDMGLYMGDSPYF